MTTIADALKATLDAQWAVPTGGTEPTWYVSDDAHSPPASGIDYVLIQSYTLTTRIDAVNNTYSNKTHLIEMEVNTPTGDNRLKELADEVERILNTVAITGVNWQKVSHRENISDKRIPFYRERITCSLLEMLASSTSAYGADTTANALNSLLMYGSANAAWVPCIFDIEQTISTVVGGGYTITNLGATDTWIQFRLPLPTVKGSLKLYVSGVKIGLLDADAGDYIDTITVLGAVFSTGTALNTNNTDYTAPEAITSTFAAVDCSSYDTVILRVTCVFTNTGDFDLTYANLRCYYDT